MPAVSWKILLHLTKEYFSVIAVLRQLSTGLHGLRRSLLRLGSSIFRDSRIVLDLSMSALDMRGEFLLHVRTISIDKTPDARGPPREMAPRSGSQAALSLQVPTWGLGLIA